MIEGQEKEDFWKLLGGKGEYFKETRSMVSALRSLHWSAAEVTQ